MDTWAVIAAAGESRRFREAGYETPKPLLRIEYLGVTSTMVDHVIRRIPPGVRIVLAHPAHASPSRSVQLCPIRETTGQAHTVLQALDAIPAEARVLTLDCDTLLEEDDLAFMIDALKYWDTVVAVTRSTDPNMSRIDSFPHPRRFVEKALISPYGIVGARAFGSRAKLRRAILLSDSEYLTPAMNYYESNKHLAYRISRWVDWGTPEKLERTGAVIV